MENTEQKTPEDWFKLLKEPYRSEAIANINKAHLNYTENPQSLVNAIVFSFHWSKTEQGFEYWEKIKDSLVLGETTYLAELELKPQDMVSGEWYVVEALYLTLIKFDSIIEMNNTNCLKVFKGIYLHDLEKIGVCAYCYVEEIKSIRPATKEEVLKHFPNEVKEEPKPEKRCDTITIVLFPDGESIMSSPLTRFECIEALKRILEFEIKKINEGN